MTPDERRKVADLLGLVLGAHSAALSVVADSGNRHTHIELVLSRLDRAIQIGHDLGMLGAGTIEVRTQP